MRLFGKRSKLFALRHDEVLNQWEVLTEAGIQYIGTKADCRRYLEKNCE